MTCGPPPLLLVEDEPLVADAIIRALRSLRQTEHVTTVEAALEQLGSSREWLGAIVDLGLPDGDGLDVIRHARLVRPLLPILVMTAHDDVRRINEVHRLGAAYSCKPCDVADVLRFVDEARRFERITSAALQRVALELARECGLTRREVDVVVATLTHRDRSEVLDDLDVTENTLKGQIKGVLRKTGHDSMQSLSRALLRSVLLER